MSNILKLLCKNVSKMNDRSIQNNVKNNSVNFFNIINQNLKKEKVLQHKLLYCFFYKIYILIYIFLTLIIKKNINRLNLKFLKNWFELI